MSKCLFLFPEGITKEQFLTHISLIKGSQAANNWTYMFARAERAMRINLIIQELFDKYCDDILALRRENEINKSE